MYARDDDGGDGVHVVAVAVVADADAQLAHHQRIRTGRQGHIGHVWSVRQGDAAAGQKAKTNDEHQTQESQSALEWNFCIRRYVVFSVCHFAISLTSD